jgi:hypothetical protein
MKAINSRRVVVLGGILVVTLAAGCFGGGRAYSNHPYDYDGGYGNSDPYNSGYKRGHSYPQSYGNANSSSAGYQDGGRADASGDGYQDRATDQHIAVTRDRDQAQTENQPPSVDRDDYSRKAPRAADRSEKN